MAAKGPVSWFKTIEIRPFADGPWLGEAAPAFGRWEDGAAIPYLLAAWTDGTPAVPSGDQAVTRGAQAWRQDVQARGLHVLGGALEGADTATTLRVRDGRTLRAHSRADDRVAGVSARLADPPMRYATVVSASGSLPCPTSFVSKFVSR